MLLVNDPSRIKSAIGNKAFTDKNGIHESINRKPWTFYHGTKSDTFDHFDPNHASKGEQYWNPLGNGMYATNNPDFAYNFGHNVHKVIIPAGSTYRRINQNTWRSVGGGLIIRALRKAFKQCGKSFDDWKNGVKPYKLADLKRLTREKQIDFIVAFYIRERHIDVRSKAETLDARELVEALDQIINITPRRRDDRAVSDFFRTLYHTLERMSPYEGLYESSAIVDMIFGHEMSEAYEDWLPKISDQAFSKYDFVVFTETNDVLGDWRTGECKSSLEVVIFNPKLQRTVPNG